MWHALYKMWDAVHNRQYLDGFVLFHLVVPSILSQVLCDLQPTQNTFQADSSFTTSFPTDELFLAAKATQLHTCSEV